MVRPGKRLPLGACVEVGGEEAADRLEGEIVEVLSGRTRRIRFFQKEAWPKLLKRFGNTPLPPYIEAPEPNQFRERYQTIYAKHPGASAAPTAGMHFTESVFKALKKKGIESVFVTLHAGLATFQPVDVEHVEDHPIGVEPYHVTEEAFQQIQRAKQEGRRIVAVGTTTVRVLETIALKGIGGLRGETKLFIYPGFQFKMVDGVITNFHLPRSTLLMLVSAFSGCERIQKAYATAIQEGYRFFSFGDATLIL